MDLLRSMFHLLHQVVMARRSDWSWMESVVDWMDLEHLVSSAKRSILEEIEEAGRSLMKIINNRGPRTLPWGTPEATGSRLERWPLTETNCWRLKR